MQKVHVKVEGKALVIKVDLSQTIGPSKKGKTTIARLLAAEVADQDFIEELDATSLTPARLQDIKATMHHYDWGPGRSRLHRQRSPRAQEGCGQATPGAPGTAPPGRGGHLHRHQRG